MNPGRRLFRCRKLLRDARSSIESDMAVVVSGGVIIDVAPYSILSGIDADVVEWDGLVIPGLIDAHSHLRGISTQRQGVADAELELWVARLSALTRLDVAADSTVAACDLLRTGVTGVQVIYHSFARPEQYVGDARAMRDSLVRVGLRGDVVLGITDTHEFVPEGESLSIQPATSDMPGLVDELTTLSLTDRPGDVRWAVGPVGPQWCTHEALAAVRRLSDRWALRVHTHLMETIHQRQWLRNETPVERLSAAGLLSSQLSVAHGVWLHDDEISQLAAAGVTFVHCPNSNLNLGSGSAPVDSWIAKGATVALGLDSASVVDEPDMFNEMRAALRSAEANGATGLHRQVLTMATTGGAKALGRRWLGAVQPGYLADLVLLVGPAADVEDVEGLLETASRFDVSTVLVGGGVRLAEDTPTGCPDVNRLRAELLDAVTADDGERRERLARLEPVEVEIDEILGRLGRRAEVAR